MELVALMEMLVHESGVELEAVLGHSLGDPSDKNSEVDATRSRAMTTRATATHTHFYIQDWPLFL